MQNGVVVQDKTNRREFTLTAGKGQIEVFEKDGVGPLATKQFTLNRGGQITVRVTFQELADAREKDQPQPPATGTFSLDHLRAEDIAEVNRLPWLPKETVAVLGEYRGRHRGVVCDVAYSRNGKLIASAGNDNFVRLWESTTLKELAVLGPHPSGVGGLDFSPDDRLLSCGTFDPDGTAFLWDLTAQMPKQ